MRTSKIKLLALAMALGLAVMLSGCVNVSFGGYGNEQLKGSGPMEASSFTVDDYTEVEISINAEVIYTAGPSGTVEVEMQQNLLDTLEVSVANGRLMVRSKYNFLFDKDNTPKVTISTPQLNALTLGGNVSITQADPINTDDFTLIFAGSCTANLAINCTTLYTSVSGRGEVELAGRADKATLSIAGTGNIDASMLESKSAEASISGSGTITTNTSDSLNVTIAGSGTIRYKGNPRISQNIGGSGSIIAI